MRFLLDTHVLLWWLAAVHCLRVGGLPWHHKDPFDRLLISQALVEDFVLISVDEKFKFYDVPLFTAIP